jgi:predicted TIM-barrel fold metal-dependent hydrolase
VPIPYRNPIHFEPLAAEYPDVPIILAHMGKHDTWFFEGALMLARKRDNVYLSTSNTRREFVARAVEEIGAERLIWGSDWSMQHGILGLRQGFDVHAINLDVVRQAGLSEDEQRLILGENLARLLGL